MRPRTQSGLVALFSVALIIVAARSSAQQGPAAAPAGSTPPAATAPATTAPDSSRPAAQTTPSTPGDSQASGGQTPTSADKGNAKDKSKAKDSKSADAAAKTDALPSPGEALNPHIKKGSEDDVDAVGTRNIGGRGMGNWYSINSEISMGKQYSMEIEKSAHLVTDPVVVEYVNRVGQNIVKNSDCKVPFTIKVIDSDEINAMALPGGFFYVNSGLILAADEEAELAGVMAHETAHVCAHHAAREMTRANYAQLSMVPLIF